MCDLEPLGCFRDRFPPQPNDLTKFVALTMLIIRICGNMGSTVKCVFRKELADWRSWSWFLYKHTSRVPLSHICGGVLKTGRN